ncbi:hypothetical protein ACHAW6_010623 [Cyclotella cf. meneghiniana]
MCVPMPAKSLIMNSCPVEHRSFPMKRRPSSRGHILTVSVPTFRVEKETKQMDNAEISSSDLNMLKRKDSFMYYSIPAARDAVIRGRELDPSVLRVSTEKETDGDRRKARN